VEFREIKDLVKHEVLPIKVEPKKMEFELKDDESDSTEEKNKNKKIIILQYLRGLVQETRKLERYTPPDFHSNFDLYIIEDNLRTHKEVVDSEDGKL
jgi:hypothetical protein